MRRSVRYLNKNNSLTDIQIGNAPNTQGTESASISILTITTKNKKFAGLTAKVQNAYVCKVFLEGASCTLL